MRVPDYFKYSLCFLCFKSGINTIYGGTAFFVRYGNPLDQVWEYLVTAKHCVKMALRDYGTLYARFNRWDDSSGLMELPNEWIFPDDEEVDIAILPREPQARGPQIIAESFIQAGIMTGGFLNKERIEPSGVGIGDDIFMLGLFTLRHGRGKNIPILRSGAIAAMPEEPMFNEQTGRPYEAFLIETRSIAGLSGSPVYVMLRGKAAKAYPSASGGVFAMEGPIDELIGVLLLGIIRGHWDMKREDSGVDFAGDLDSTINTGIAIVTPAWEILNLIENNPKLKANREKDKEARLKRSAPTLDSGFQGQARAEGFTQADFEAALRKVGRKIEMDK
jgi:hypothetical protein